MPVKLTTLEELAQALDGGARSFVLDGKLAGLVAKAKADGPKKVCGDLTKLFDQGQARLDRELCRELGGDIPQKAKDLMRAQTLAAMEKLIAAVLAEIKAYHSRDGKLYELG